MKISQITETHILLKHYACPMFLRSTLDILRRREFAKTLQTQQTYHECKDISGGAPFTVEVTGAHSQEGARVICGSFNGRSIEVVFIQNKALVRENTI